MIDVRRWYLYLVSAITVQAFAWALISFCRHLLLERPVDREMVALQLAAMIVTLPLFLVHWLWAQRLAGRDREERASFPRRLYLTGMLAAFLAPLVYNAFNGLRGLLNLLLGGPFSGEWAFGAPLTSGETALYALPALVVLAAFWGFHWVIRGRDDRRQAESLFREAVAEGLITATRDPKTGIRGSYDVQSDGFQFQVSDFSRTILINLSIKVKSLFKQAASAPSV